MLLPVLFLVLGPAVKGGEAGGALGAGGDGAHGAGAAHDGSVALLE